MMGKISIDKIDKYLELPVEVVKELADNLLFV